MAVFFFSTFNGKIGRKEVCFATITAPFPDGDTAESP
jgi:hypothetical protein